MGKYGNIDGISTLTNNPIAIDNARGTIGKCNGFWGNTAKMQEVGIKEITKGDSVRIIKEICTKK